MMLATQETVIAMDGGGTHCRLALEGPAGRYSCTHGSANVSSDFEAAIGQIRAGLAELAEAAAIPWVEVAEIPSYLGLAGVTDPELAHRVAARLGLRRARVEDDRPCALRGALGVADGAVAHFGTGSFFAVQRAGRVRLAGGWGPRLGDTGSAYWVARRALSAVLDGEDGLIDHSDLTEALLSRLGAPGGVVSFAAEAAPATLAELARSVTEAADMGDNVARRILQDGADHISDILLRMGWHAGMALCLTGGLGPCYRGYLSAEVAGAVVPPRADPLEGALELAHAFAAESVL